MKILSGSLLIMGFWTKYYSEVLSVTLQWLDVAGEKLPTVYVHQNFIPTHLIQQRSSNTICLDTRSLSLFDIMGRVKIIGTYLSKGTHL